MGIQNLSANQHMAKKAPKGTVSVESYKERLRLRWNYQGKRYCFYIGLPDSKINQAVAAQRAKQIEVDCATGNFDRTLKKYRFTEDSPKALAFEKLWVKFVEYKRSRVLARTITTTFDPVAVKVKAFGQIETKQDAERFMVWIQTQVSKSWAKRILIMLNACYQWGIEQEIISVNPFTGLAKAVKVPPKQPPIPFSREEKNAIIEGLRADTKLSHYADFVEFLFETGCRTGEAIGLLWKHVSEDCSQIWIGESLSRGVRKSTKNNKALTITVTPTLQTMLQSRKPENCNPEFLVFSEPSGCAIEDNNFRNRAWKVILARLGIPYKKPYSTRHAFISHAVDSGMSLMQVSQITRHSIRVLTDHYAGHVRSEVKLPEVW
jgi:integrase